eukprot:g36264.t1
MLFLCHLEQVSGTIPQNSVQRCTTPFIGLSTYWHEKFSRIYFKKSSPSKPLTLTIPDNVENYEPAPQASIFFSTVNTDMRLRGDLIEVYKIMRGIDKVNNKGLFPE